MIAVSTLLSRRYNKRTYHCVHFAVDVWKNLTGSDLSEQFAPILGPITKMSAVQSLWDGFSEVPFPTAPCLVLMRSGTNEPHIGVYHEGRILHMRETGPHAAVIPQLRREYKHMRFFVCEK